MALFGRPSEREEERARAYGGWLRERHPLAIASLVLGVFSLIEFGVLVVFGVAGIVLGVTALRQMHRNTSRDTASASMPQTRGHRLAWAGIVTSVVSLMLAVLVYARII